MAITINILSSFKNAGFQRLEKELSRLESPMQKIQATARALGPAATIGFGALAFGATQAIQAAEAAEVADNRLKQIAQSMGIFGAETDKVTARLGAFAEQTMKTTAIDDEQIKATQAKLLTFKNLAQTADTVGGAMDRATLAAIDLAAAGFGSAETNAVQLGKALQDPVKGITALARAGVTFTKEEKEKIKTLVESGKMLEAQNLILGAIETQVGGTAEATATGSQRMNAAFGELSEKIGTALLPVFEALVPVVISLITFMQDNTGVVITLGVVFATMAAAIIAVNVAMYANPISLIIAGVAALVVGIVLLVNWLVQLAGGWTSVTKGFMEGLAKIGAFFTTIFTTIQTTVKTVFDFLVKTWNGAVLGVKNGLTELSNFFNSVFEAIGQGIVGYINGWIGVFEGFVNRVVGGLNGIISLANQALSAIASATGGAINIKVPTVKTIKIPKLANGGIVMPRPGGVIANLAEAGKPEAVIPLDRLGSFGGGKNISITVNAGLGTDGTRVGQLIVDEIKKFERSSGPVFASA
jgi:phage-related protein